MLVAKEQSFVQRQIDALKNNDPKAFGSIMQDINGLLNMRGFPAGMPAMSRLKQKQANCFSCEDGFLPAIPSYRQGYPQPLRRYNHTVRILIKHYAESVQMSGGHENRSFETTSSILLQTAERVDRLMRTLVTYTREHPPGPSGQSLIRGQPR